MGMDKKVIGNIDEDARFRISVNPKLFNGRI